MLKSAGRGMNYRHPLLSQYVKDTRFEFEGTSAKANIAVGFATRTL
jgi:hypothetical protein